MTKTTTTTTVKPRLGKLRQTGTIAVWLKSFCDKKNKEATTDNGLDCIYTKTVYSENRVRKKQDAMFNSHKSECHHINEFNLRVRRKNIKRMDLKETDWSTLHFCSQSLSTVSEYSNYSCCSTSNTILSM